ncbi:hypothetical protein BE20_10345 [Sorangium cellulosum]|nr:hypothetical protein BE20_10345 [Sorangium cellulosum]
MSTPVSPWFWRPSSHVGAEPPSPAHTTEIVWLGGKQESLFTPPQASMPMHGRATYVLLQLHSKPSAVSSTTPGGPQSVPTVQVRPSHSIGPVGVPSWSAWQRCSPPRPCRSPRRDPGCRGA